MQDLAPLEEIERLRAEFLDMVSHELRAPLTSIKGAAASSAMTQRPGYIFNQRGVGYRMARPCKP